MIFCFVRETKQLTLEELDRKSTCSLLRCSALLTSLPEVFSVPTKQFISHEIKYSVPYFFKRHVFRQKVPKPPAIIAVASESKKDNGSNSA